MLGQHPLEARRFLQPVEPKTVTGMPRCLVGPSPAAVTPTHRQLLTEWHSLLRATLPGSNNQCGAAGEAEAAAVAAVARVNLRTGPHARN